MTTHDALVDLTPPGTGSAPLTCPACAKDLVKGRCVDHGMWYPGGSQVVRIVPRPVVAPTRRWPVAVAVGAATVVVAVLGAGLLSVRGDVARLRGADQAAAVREAGLRRQVADGEAALAAAGKRIGELEAARDAAPDPAAVAERVQQSVFTVVTAVSEGSGWAVTADEIVTNYHVIADAWADGRHRVTIHQGDRTWPGTIVEASPGDDLAVIAVDGATFSPLERSGSRAKVGDSVLVVGSPLGLGGTVASGIVSSYRTDAGLEYLQFSAPVSPGSSGGPVVDAHGRVIGVAVSKYVAAGAEGLSFAIPTGRACDALAVC
ncbi:MAG TPA: trypsin-like peptidase domain-containing protein [Acidimicrobiales bacterium]|nr:trypsin-like peptidase domain-containing protein [Acidimicrobiales bacterium]